MKLFNYRNLSIAGIMGLFSALLHKDFYNYCYQKMGKNLDKVGRDLRTN
jgi:hypothetical protein